MFLTSSFIQNQVVNCVRAFTRHYNEYNTKFSMREEMYINTYNTKDHDENIIGEKQVKWQCRP